jgi:hypothetical protein
MAQLGRALLWGGRGREFESLCSDQITLLSTPGIFISRYTLTLRLLNRAERDSIGQTNLME